MTIPILQYLVAFQNNAFDDPALITTIASPPGTLGGNNVWTDITRYVLSDTGSRGRQHELTQFEAGTRQLLLDNGSNPGIFTPWNTSSPYSPYVVPRKPFQVRATWPLTAGTTYPQFTGQVDSWAVGWPDPTLQQVTCHVSDAFRVFNLANITTGGYPAQVIADGATGYWRCGDPAGATLAADSSGNNHPAQVVLNNGTVTFGQNGILLSNPGTGVSLETATGNQAPNLAFGSWLPTAPSSLTVEYWMQSSDTTDGMVSLALLYGTAGTWYMWSLGTTAATPLVYVEDQNALSNLVSVSRQLFDGNAHYLAATIAAGGTTLYIDGVQVATTASLPGSNATQNPWGLPPNAIWPNSTSGSIEVQEAAVYSNVALTPTQVTNHYQLGAWPQEGTGARVTRVLNAINWSSGARAIDNGRSTVQRQTSSLATTSSLSHMQSVESTEVGALFVNVAGKLTFLARTTFWTNTLYTTSQQTFGDNTAGGDIPYQPAPTLAIDDIDLYNEAYAQRTGGNPQITDNAASIAANGRNTWNPSGTLLGVNDLEVLELTQYIVGKFGTPVPRLAAITIDVTSLCTAFPATVGDLLGLELMERVTVERTLVPGGGTAFSQVGVIEHISRNINAAAGTFTITLGLAIADPAMWVLGVGALGSTTALSF